jgi:adenine/guanine/hypoxanthine permease
MRGSSFTTEFIGGSTTFFSGCYIMAINPIILQPTGIPLTTLFFSTTLAAALFTFVMGAAVNLPIMLAPGMGLNALLATACAQGSGGYTWPQGMAAVLLSGVLYLVRADGEAEMEEGRVRWAGPCGMGTCELVDGTRLSL